MSEIFEVVGNLERIIEKSGGRYYIVSNVEDESKWNCNKRNSKEIEEGKVMLSSRNTNYTALEDVAVNTTLPGNIKVLMKYTKNNNYNNLLEQDDAIVILEVEALEASLIEADKQNVKSSMQDLMVSANALEQYEEHLINGYAKAKELSEHVNDEKALPLFFDKMVSPYYYFVQNLVK